MTTWKLTLEYDGTKYSGWQEQKNARTVQGALRTALEKVFGVELELQGSGRTDAGVHALAQVAHVRVRSGRHSPGQIREALNEALPADVVVLDVERTAARFHARHDALTRTYIYQISTRKRAFAKRYMWWVKEEQDTDAMSRAAALLPGRHDIRCFRAPDPSKPDESTIVVVESAGIRVDADLIVFHIEASHFLWRMVRRIVGVLVKIGTGEITEPQFRQLLEGRCSKELDVAAWTAPSAGLFLESVRYR